MRSHFDGMEVRDQRRAAGRRDRGRGRRDRRRPAAAARRRADGGGDQGRGRAAVSWCASPSPRFGVAPERDETAWGSLTPLEQPRIGRRRVGSAIARRGGAPAPPSTRWSSSAVNRIGFSAASQRKKPNEPGHGLTSLSQTSPVFSFDRKSIRGAPVPPTATKASAAQLPHLRGDLGGQLRVDVAGQRQHALARARPAACRSSSIRRRTCISS